METHEGQFGFWIRLTDSEMESDVPFSLDAYITIGDDDEVCKNQDGLMIQSVNPCPTTEIFDLVVPDLITVMQGNTDTSFEFSVWPPVDNIGYADSGEYGIDRCGTKSYTLKDENNLVIDWITILPDGTLKVQPGLELLDQIHEIDLTVTLDDYLDTQGMSITTSTTLMVEVQPCVPSIDTSSSLINDVFYHRWGDQQPSIRSFQPFQYTAGCALEFTYTAKL